MKKLINHYELSYDIIYKEKYVYVTNNGDGMATGLHSLAPKVPRPEPQRRPVYSP